MGDLHQLKEAITCRTCNGHGYLGAALVVLREGREVNLDKGNVCAPCGGSGIKPMAGEADG